MSDLQRIAFAEQTSTTTLRLAEDGPEVTIRATVRMTIPNDWPGLLSMEWKYEPILPWEIQDSAIDQRVRDAHLWGMTLLPGPFPAGGRHVTIDELTIDPLPSAAASEADVRRVGELFNCVVAGMTGALMCALVEYAPAERIFDETLKLIRSTAHGHPLVSPVTTEPVGNECSEVRTWVSATEQLANTLHRYVMATYPKLPKSLSRVWIPGIRSVIQWSRHWQAAGGVAWESILESQEMTDLRRVSEIYRLSHDRTGRGIRQYLHRMGDEDRVSNGWVIVTEEEFERYAALLSKLVQGLEVSLE